VQFHHARVLPGHEEDDDVAYKLWTSSIIIGTQLFALVTCSGRDAEQVQANSALSQAGETCWTQSQCAEGLVCRGVDSDETKGACAVDVVNDPGQVYVDSATQLEWQQNPVGGPLDFASAITHCNQLELQGGGWRLPTIEELRTLLRGCPASEIGGACQATEKCRTFDACLVGCNGCELEFFEGEGCYRVEGLAGSCDWYWSSTELDNMDGAWYVVFSSAHICGRSKDVFGQVRCVR
jgi:Protein of unknown function (DUF1566)